MKIYSFLLFPLIMKGIAVMIMKIFMKKFKRKIFLFCKGSFLLFLGLGIKIMNILIVVGKLWKKSFCRMRWLIFFLRSLGVIMIMILKWIFISGNRFFWILLKKIFNQKKSKKKIFLSNFAKKLIFKPKSQKN